MWLFHSSNDNQHSICRFTVYWCWYQQKKTSIYVHKKLYIKWSDSYMRLIYYNANKSTPHNCTVGSHTHVNDIHRIHYNIEHSIAQKDEYMRPSLIHSVAAWQAEAQITMRLRLNTFHFIWMWIYIQHLTHYTIPFHTMPYHVVLCRSQWMRS